MRLKKMRMNFAAFSMVLCSLVPVPARADFWGGDVILLAQILTNSVQQLTQLKNILDTGQDSFNLVQDINRGLRDGLSMMRLTGSAAPRLPTSCIPSRGSHRGPVQGGEECHVVIVGPMIPARHVSSSKLWTWRSCADGKFGIPMTPAEAGRAGRT